MVANQWMVVTASGCRVAVVVDCGRMSTMIFMAGTGMTMVVASIMVEVGSS